MLLTPLDAMVKKILRQTVLQTVQVQKVQNKAIQVTKLTQMLNHPTLHKMVIGQLILVMLKLQRVTYLPAKIMNP